MEDSQSRCSVCGADYLSTVLSEISGGRADEDAVSLDALEASLQSLDTAPLPTFGETLRRQSGGLYAAAAGFCVVAGIATRANIFYLVALVLIVLLIPKVVARLRHKSPLGQGEVLVQATARIFTEDASAVRARMAGRKDVDARLIAMQQRVDRALALQREGHARNGRRILLMACVVLLVACIGVGVLAVHNYGVRKAAAEYAAQPEWVKLRDGYLARATSDEYGGQQEREAVLRAMLGAGETSEAEDFFFTCCQGKVGDLACAMLFVAHYREAGDSEALRAFTARVTLRYDSDTRKIRSIKP